MVAADTSSMVAFLQEGEGDDVEVIQSALEHQQLVLPPVVLTELLSEPALPQTVRSLLAGAAAAQYRAGLLGAGRAAARLDPETAAQGPHRRCADCAELPRSVGPARHPRQGLSPLRQICRSRTALASFSCRGRGALHNQAMSDKAIRDLLGKALAWHDAHATFETRCRTFRRRHAAGGRSTCRIPPGSSSSTCASRSAISSTSASTRTTGDEVARRLLAIVAGTAVRRGVG